MALRASISVEVLQASVSSAKLTTSVTYELANATGIWMDADSKNRFLYEEVAVNDVQINWVQKVFTDDTYVAEDAVYAFYKVRADSYTITDHDVLHLYKNIANTLALTEEHWFDVEKPLEDTVASLDDLAYAYIKKAKEDTASIAEADYKGFYKALEDASSLMDAIDTVAFFKNTQDIAEFSDEETFAFAKFLFDTVGVTDDIDGAASILDDQEMQYHKITTDVYRATDIFVRVVNYVRSFTSAAGLADDNVLSTVKGLTNNTLFTDVHRTDASKLLNDLPRVADALAIGLTKAPFLDSAALSDVATLNPGKIITNTASLSDTGSLRSQGYSDFTFFAEDYVGASRNF